MRIILAATALKALIGNDFAPGTAATGGHQLARRAAFVWCGAEFGDRHGSQRPICPFLAELNGRRLEQKLRSQATRGVPRTCSYYTDLRDLYDDRNAALHAADVRFTEQLASRHEFTIEQVLFEVLEWVTTGGAQTFAQYEDAIRALPER